MSKKVQYQAILKDAGLKVTPQRLAVLEKVMVFKGHPTAEEISVMVKEEHPSIAFGTVYNVLDSLVNAGILRRVKTDRGAMLYDSVTDKHHHLYCNESERIEDYYNTELDKVLEEFFETRKIEGFEIEDIKLQLVGRFKKNKENHQSNK